MTFSLLIFFIQTIYFIYKFIPFILFFNLSIKKNVKFLKIGKTLNQWCVCVGLDEIPVLTSSRIENEECIMHWPHAYQARNHFSYIIQHFTRSTVIVDYSHCNLKSTAENIRTHIMSTRIGTSLAGPTTLPTQYSFFFAPFRVWVCL